MAVRTRWFHYSIFHGIFCSIPNIARSSAMTAFSTTAAACWAFTTRKNKYGSQNQQYRNDLFYRVLFHFPVLPFKLCFSSFVSYRFYILHDRSIYRQRLLQNFIFPFTRHIIRTQWSELLCRMKYQDIEHPPENIGSNIKIIWRSVWKKNRHDVFPQHSAHEWKDDAFRERHNHRLLIYTEWKDQVDICQDSNSSKKIIKMALKNIFDGRQGRYSFQPESVQTI